MPLHPESKRFLALRAVGGVREWYDMPVEEARELFKGFRQWELPPEPVELVQDIQLAGAPVRHYRPPSSGLLPAIVYFHGGGWVLGNLDSLDGTLRRLAIRANCAVFSVDYRLAPEHKFPAALDDCCRVVRHVIEHAGDLQIDPERITISGDSAGGNLATATCLRLRDEEGPRPARQLLVYPVIDSACDSDSYREFSEGYGLTAETMRWFWRQYLPDEASSRDGRASPAHAEELSGLPPAIVLTAEYDVLRDEGERYAERLRAAGVEVVSRRVNGAIHGFFHLAGAFSQGAEAIDEVADLLK